MQDLKKTEPHGDDGDERLTMARAVARAVELGVRLHRESSPVHQWEERSGGMGTLSPLAVERAAIWLQQQWIDTGECSIEDAAFHFELPPVELRKRLEEYFRAYSRYGRQN